jgi:leucine-zipper-like transcriptional regulator 1
MNRSFQLLILAVLLLAAPFACTRKYRVDPLSPSASTPTPAINNSTLGWVQSTSSAAFGTRAGLTSVVFNNEMWVIGGSDNRRNTTTGFEYVTQWYNDTWHSTNGSDWTQGTGNAAFSGRSSHTSLVYNNAIWVIAGDAGGLDVNDIWSSTDGVSWNQKTANAAFSKRWGHSSLVYNGKMWVIGGLGGNFPISYLNDVWYSTDGINWTQATAAAGFSPRYYHTSVVYNNAIWVIGGVSGLNTSDLHNDVWYSTDGINWTQATAAAGFSPRACHTSVVFNNAMWVIGGLSDYGSGGNNDSWFSTDGVNWTQATGTPYTPVRYGHSSLVYSNSMWVMGGLNRTIGLSLNDVWHSP